MENFILKLRAQKQDLKFQKKKNERKKVKKSSGVAPSATKVCCTSSDTIRKAKHSTHHPCHFVAIVYMVRASRSDGPLFMKRDLFFFCFFFVFFFCRPFILLLFLSFIFRIVRKADSVLIATAQTDQCAWLFVDDYVSNTAGIHWQSRNRIWLEISELWFVFFYRVFL